METNSTPKKKMSLFKKITLGFFGFFILIIILSKLFPIDYYKDGLDYYNKKNYTKAFEYFNNVKSDDKNYNDAISKINELKPIVDSLKAMTSTTKIENQQNQESQQQKDDAEKIGKDKELAEIKENTITAKQLTEIYEANEVNADNNYKGKTFYVTGTVTEIKKDMLDNIYVALEGDEMFRQVQCYFEDKEIAGQMHKGMKVTFKGTCDGLMVNVLMKDCKLVQ